MVTISAYYRDPYLRELETEILTATEKGLILKDTIFYPRGGGQPDDEGTITYNNQEVRVVGLKKTQSGIEHILDPMIQARPGDSVLLRINWERRYNLMKLHTALHVLSALVYKKYGKLVTGGNISPDKARLDFDLEKLTSEIKQDLEDELNAELEKGHEVETKFLPRKEAEKIPALIRTKINLLPEEIDPIRVVRIGDIDYQADGGLHVANTREIGRIRIVKIENKGKGRKRITIAFA